MFTEPLGDSSMSDTIRKAHWETVYTTKSEDEVSWFQENPAPSLELIDLARPGPDSAIADIGGGASRLVDSLVARGFQNLTVLDLSEAALISAKTRLGDAGKNVQWVAADVTTWSPGQTFDIWHDRAAFHFLIESVDRAAYVERLTRATKFGSHAIIGTFALDGPEKCSGLPVHRHDSKSLAAELGGEWELIHSRRHEHSTPWDSTQRFQFSVFRRSA
jgi:hypothetical protein